MHRYNLPVMDDDKLIILNEKSQRADAVRNRQRLIDTARRLFEAEGVEAVSMSALAKEAGVGKGTLYRHFSDKASVCHAVLDDAMRLFQTQTLGYLSLERPALDKLRWFIRRAVQYTADHLDLLREAALSGETSSLEHPAHIWWRQTIYGLLAQTAYAGDIDYLTDMIYIMLDVRAIRYQMRARGYSVTYISNGLIETLDHFF